MQKQQCWLKLPLVVNLPQRPYCGIVTVLWPVQRPIAMIGLPRSTPGIVTVENSG